MLYVLHHLAMPDTVLTVFNIFRYITFRAAMAAMSSFLLVIVLMPIFIKVMRNKGLTDDPGKSDSDFVREKHAGKKGVPTMGGAVAAAAVIVSGFLWARIDNNLAFYGIFLFLGFALLGFADDYRKVRYPGVKGLSIKAKLAGQVVLGAAGALIIMSEGGKYADTVSIPLVKPEIFLPHLGAWFAFWGMFVLVAYSNSVNLADGLDGLAGGLLLEVTAVAALLAYVAGHAGLSAYLQVPSVPQAGELMVLGMAAVGALLGFLWFNAHPADVFMGDTGSLSFGALCGYIGLAAKQELLLVVTAAILVFEALSVLLQIVSFRFFGKRIFLVAPFHHHLERKGWPEQKIVVRLWLAGAVAAVLSLSLLKVR
ncbi:MAG TPA: phospho-N-acetylmuramoyl-pentapeptide-transferase [Planctomycetes bacterium]|nr:phospho-N-acetylmuramoyl-pentapeptide-transferase [Planctomycetota bacterium]